MTRQQRAAIAAFGQFVIAIEEAFPHEAADTSQRRKRRSPSRAYRWPTGWSTRSIGLLRNAIDSTAKSHRRRQDGKAPNRPGRGTARQHVMDVMDSTRTTRYDAYKAVRGLALASVGEFASRSPSAAHTGTCSASSYASTTS
jgi:hypothetical protein